jgi:hypothetical protein
LKYHEEIEMKRRTDDDEIEDGRSVRVPMVIMDGRVNLTDVVRYDENHQPHFMRAAGDGASRDDDPAVGARDARREMIETARNAWMGDARKKKRPDPDPDEDDDDDEGPVWGPGFAVDARDALADHRPGFGGMRAVAAYAKFCRDAGHDMPEHPSAAANQKAYETYRRSICNAWRTAPNPTPWAASRSDIEAAKRAASWLGMPSPMTASSGPPFTDPTSSAGQRVEKELRGRDGLADRKADPNAASAVENRLERERGRNAGAEADLERDRRRIHAEYSNHLQNAWRRPA